MIQQSSERRKPIFSLSCAEHTRFHLRSSNYPVSLKAACTLQWPSHVDSPICLHFNSTTHCFLAAPNKYYTYLSHIDLEKMVYFYAKVKIFLMSHLGKKFPPRLMTSCPAESRNISIKRLPASHIVHFRTSFLNNVQTDNFRFSERSDI